MSKKTFFWTFYSFTQSGQCVYVYGLGTFTKEAYLCAARNTFTSVACLRSQRKRTYVLGTMRWDGNWEGAWGDGDGERGVGGGGEKGKRRGWGERGWRGGAREGTKIGWLMLFYNNGHRIGSGGGGKGEGKEVRIGRQGMGKENQGGGQGLVGWLMLFNDTWSQ